MFSRAAILAVVVLAAGQAAASARSLTASDPRKEFVFSNELLAELARNPPKTAAPLNPRSRRCSHHCGERALPGVAPRGAARLTLGCLGHRSRRANWRHVEFRVLVGGRVRIAARPMRAVMCVHTAPQKRRLARSRAPHIPPPLTSQPSEVGCLNNKWPAPFNWWVVVPPP